MEKNGSASTTMTAAATTLRTSLCSATMIDQRDQKPRVGSEPMNSPLRTARRCLRGSTFSPNSESNAGNSVSDAAAVRVTATAAPIAMPLKKLTPRASSPSNAMHTVVAANSTARPEVFIEVTIESVTPTPRRRLRRCRVTMNSA